jgi:hypothetical protein
MTENQHSDDKTGMIYFSKTMHQEIRYHWKRFGLPAWKILDRVSPRRDRLTIMMLNDWISNRVRLVNQDDWNSILAVCKNLADTNLSNQQDQTEYRRVGYPPNVEGTTRLDVTPQMFQMFMTELERTGAEVKLDLVDSEHAPEGLNERVVQIFRRQEAKTIRSDYWTFMIATLASMPDQESIL